MTEDEVVGRHHCLNGYASGQTQGDSDGRGSLACCSPWGCKESDVTQRLNNIRTPTGKDVGNNWQGWGSRRLLAETSPECELRETGGTASTEMTGNVTLHQTWDRKTEQRCPVPPVCRTLPSKGYYEDPAQTLTLSKLRSIKLIEDVPFQNMPVLHPDEKASEENEFGPLSNDDICITSDSPIRLT